MKKHYPPLNLQRVVLALVMSLFSVLPTLAIGEITQSITVDEDVNVLASTAPVYSQSYHSSFYLKRAVVTDDVITLEYSIPIDTTNLNALLDEFYVQIATVNNEEIIPSILSVDAVGNKIISVTIDETTFSDDVVSIFLDSDLITNPTGEFTAPEIEGELCAYGYNLLGASGFEDFDNWEATKGDTYSLITEDPDPTQGNKCLKMESGIDGMGFVCTEGIPFDENTKYQLSMDLRAEPGISGSLEITRFNTSPNDGKVGADVLSCGGGWMSAWSISSTKWTTFTRTIEVYSGEPRKLYYNFIHYGGEGTIYVDNIRLYEEFSRESAGFEADFKSDATYSDTAPYTVAFRGAVRGIAGTKCTWDWDLDGDGQTDATDRNPTMEYTESGRYDVRLIVSNEDETLTDTIIQEKHVKVGTYTLTLDDIDFNSETGMITNCICDNEPKIIIPAFFEVNGEDVQVIGIGKNAFDGISLTDVVLPETIVIIEESAFANNALIAIVLPSSLSAIGKEAFVGNDISQATIPLGVISIGDGAFANNSLVSVTLSANLIEIGSNAFINNSLTSVAFPVNLTEIGAKAFCNNSLSDITIPPSVTSIGGGAFNQNELTLIDGQPSNGIVYARDENGNDDLSTIVSYGGVSTVIDFIPSEVTVIADYAFESSSLISLTIPNNVVAIGHFAFSNNLLSEVIIPEFLTTIEDNVFSGNKLTTISIPASVTSIAYGAFMFNELTEVIFSDSVKHIGEWAFYGNDLNEVVIPASVETIGRNAFDSNYSLTNVTFEPLSQLHAICFNAFSNGNNISFTLPTSGVEGFSYYVNGEGDIYNSGGVLNNVNLPITINIPHTLTSDDVIIKGDTISNYLGGYLNIVIPDSLDNNPVSVISNRAFQYDFLISVMISKGITSIGNSAFAYNYLSEVIFEDSSNLKTIGSSAFVCYSWGSSLDSIILPSHSSANFVQYIDKNGDAYNPGDAITNFQASYMSQIGYTVSYDAGGALGDVSETVSILSGDTLIISDEGNLHKEGADFIAWSLEEKGVKYDANDTIIMPHYDMNLVALWHTPNSVEELLEETVQLFPNPTASLITVKAEKAYSLRLFDVSGNLLLQKDMDALSVDLDLSSYSDGVYLLQLYNGDEAFVKRIIKSNR